MMNPKRSDVTLRDVARHAGVSHQTVSRVINENDHVNPETRDRVMQAIAELGYRPNAIARSMAQGRSYKLACLSPNLTDFTFAAIIEGAEREARQHGYFLLPSSVQDVSTFEALAEELVSSHRVEGLMVIYPYMDERYCHLPENSPVVFVGAHPRSQQVNSVSLDSEYAARLATQHLVDLGHKKIAMVTGPMNEDSVHERLSGFKTVMVQNGTPPDPDLIHEGDWAASSGVDAVQDFLDTGKKFTAIFAQNDRMAIGVLSALRHKGIRVPEDVSVVGFDDMPLASYFDPPLTTIRQDFTAIGEQAVHVLMNKIEKPGTPLENRVLSAELIVRGSTCPLR